MVRPNKPFEGHAEPEIESTTMKRTPVTREAAGDTNQYTTEDPTFEHYQGRSNRAQLKSAARDITLDSLDYFSNVVHYTYKSRHLSQMHS